MDRPQGKHAVHELPNRGNANDADLVGKNLLTSYSTHTAHYFPGGWATLMGKHIGFVFSAAGKRAAI